MKSLASRFGEDPMILTNADTLTAIRPMRSLLTGSKFGNKATLFGVEPPFINEDEAIKEDIMAGVRELPAGSDPDMEGSGIVETGLKLAGKLGTALKIGKAIGSLATGEVGTTISNKLSERFNSNPAWRPGFVGEAHLVLPTKSGLTRANFCGPGTNLLARLNRGDRGVSQVDTACSKHDMLYHLAKTTKDIRKADNILIKDIDNTTDISGVSGRVQRGILKAGLRAKTLGEDVGLFGPETFTQLPGLEGRGLRGQHAMMACSLANRLGHKTGPFARICDMQGTGVISNPMEATDLSHKAARDPEVANLSGRGIVEDITEVIGKPADKLRKSVFKDINRARRKAQKLRISDDLQKMILQARNSIPMHRTSVGRRGKGFTLPGAGLSLPGMPGTGLALAGQEGGQFGILASLAASFIVPKIIEAIAGKRKGRTRDSKGKGAFGDFFKGFVQGFTDPVGGVIDAVKFFKGKGRTKAFINAGMHRDHQRGGNPRDPTLQNLQGRGVVQDVGRIAKKKNPGHTLGEELLKLHGLSASKLSARMRDAGITEAHLVPMIRKMILSPAFKKKMRGKGINPAGGQMSGGQFGILASLAASFIVPKIVNAIAGKKIL